MSRKCFLHNSVTMRRARCRRLQSYRPLLANSLIYCSRYLPLARSVLLELFANVLAIIQRCLQTGRYAHAPCQLVLQTRRRQALLAKRVSRTFLTSGGPQKCVAVMVHR